MEISGPLQVSDDGLVFRFFNIRQAGKAGASDVRVCATLVPPGRAAVHTRVVWAAELCTRGTRTVTSHHRHFFR